MGAGVRAPPRPGDGVPVSRGRHLRMLQMNTSSRFHVLVGLDDLGSIWPGPTDERQCLAHSSSAPGASPTNTTSQEGSPLPKTKFRGSCAEGDHFLALHGRRRKSARHPSGLGTTLADPGHPTRAGGAWGGSTGRERGLPTKVDPDGIFDRARRWVIPLLGNLGTAPQTVSKGPQFLALHGPLLPFPVPRVVQIDQRSFGPTKIGPG
jgi:hypothetical protein